MQLSFIENIHFATETENKNVKIKNSSQKKN